MVQVVRVRERAAAETGMTTMRTWVKRMLTTLAGLAVAGLFGAFLFAWSGFYNIGASAGHWAIIRWFLEFGMRNAVETHAVGIDVPPLDELTLFYKGLGHYQGGCAPCHGSPAEPPNPIALQTLPPPPYLPHKVRDWSPPELFWIVKHGLKYTGMPAWPAQARDDEIWAVVAFLIRLPELSADEYRRLARGDARVGRPASEERARLIARAGGAGERLVACARCHGLQGEGGGAGAFPRLAGQKSEYLYEALRGYALGARPSGIMQPIASELTDDEMRELATYYAAVEAPPLSQPQAEDLRLIQLGGAIAAAGLPDQKIPPCASCHGRQGYGEGTSPFYPRLAGQYAAYLALQLQLWRSGVRGATPTSQIMAVVASGLSDEQIRAVSLYYASIRWTTSPTAPKEPTRW